MSKVSVTKEKLDILANAIANKSGEPLTLTLDEMVSAVDGIETGGGGITPTGNIDIMQAGVTDVTNYATATVPTLESYMIDTGIWYETESGQRKWKVEPVLKEIMGEGGFVGAYAYYYGAIQTYNAVASGTTVTPSTSAQTIGGRNYMMEGAVTVNAIPSEYIVPSGTVTLTDNTFDNTGISVRIRDRAIVNVCIEFDIDANNNVTCNRTWDGCYEAIQEGYTYTIVKYNNGGYGASLYGIDTNTGELHFVVFEMPSNGVCSPMFDIYYPYNGTPYKVSPSNVLGTAGTPTATKGTVSNHSVSVTPSVTNTTGYITGSTKTGTAVTVSASELVSGSETKTENGTYDVTNLAEIIVDVSGGGSSDVQIGIGTPQSGANGYVQFGDLLGTPTSFSLINAYDIAVGTDPIVSALTYDGTNYVGQTVTNTANANASYLATGFSYEYYGNDHGIIVRSTNATFDTYSHYVLVYTYGGSASDIQTANVQVGSGATSITFPVSGRPKYWSCVFKSNFGTSQGYQRVIAVANDGTNTIGTYGLCLDSSAHASNSYWTANYSGGNFTISSQSTNAGGYFHQPGYYQLTYIVDSNVTPEYQTKTVTPTTSQQIVTPDSGYDALSQVTVNAIPSQYIIPSGNLPITANGNNINVSQYATVSVNVPTGGGSSMNAQSAQSTTRATSTSYTECISLTCDTSGTYDVYWSTFRSSTSGTWGSQLYLGNTAYGSAQTGSWSNHIQNIHLTNVQIDANEEVSVRVRSRGNSYYGYVGTLTIIQKS